jgi:predicted neutral ceramidase superfamily lipid hydrolase
MIQSQYHSPSGRQRVGRLQRHVLLRRHPVLVPVTLLGSALVLCLVSFYANSLFPLLTWVGIPSQLLCLLLALVLGISGILTSIVGLIERMDRSRTPVHNVSEYKGGNIV